MLVIHQQKYLTIKIKTFSTEHHYVNFPIYIIESVHDKGIQ